MDPVAIFVVAAPGDHGDVFLRDAGGFQHLQRHVEGAAGTDAVIGKYDLLARFWLCYLFLAIRDGLRPPHDNGTFCRRAVSKGGASVLLAGYVNSSNLTGAGTPVDQFLKQPADWSEGFVSFHESRKGISNIQGEERYFKTFSEGISQMVAPGMNIKDGIRFVCFYLATC